MTRVVALIAIALGVRIGLRAMAAGRAGWLVAVGAGAAAAILVFVVKTALADPAMLAAPADWGAAIAICPIGKVHAVMMDLTPRPRCLAAFVEISTKS